MPKYLLTIATLTLPALAAAADTQPIRVTLATATADGLVRGTATRWQCAGMTCTGAASNAAKGDARACREIAGQVGTLVAYVSGRGAMDADALAKCNAHARTAG